METILKNEFLACIIVLISQICFLFFRTLNTIHVSKKNMTGSILTEAGTSFCRLLSLLLGVNSVINGGILVMITYIIGALIGTYWGIKQKK
jgi:type IV secretory pathway VirB6-like protein